MIGNLCGALLSAYRERGQDPSAELLPGHSRAEIATKTSWFPASLPEPLLDLYAWRNGQPEDAWETDRVFWFRDMQFTSLERAHEEYQSMMDSYGVENSRELDGIDLGTSFPFASFNGGWYVVPCTPHDLDPEHAFPVVRVFQGIDIHFHSIERMLETCIGWRLASKHVDGGAWELDEDLERTIWCHHNPGIFD